MSCVLDPCALALIRLPEEDERRKAIDHVLDNRAPCYVTAAGLAEFYRIVHAKLPERADLLLDESLNNVRLIDERHLKLIRTAASIRDGCGVSYVTAFPAAYAHIHQLPYVAAMIARDDTAILSAELVIPEMQIIERHGVCEVEWI